MSKCPRDGGLRGHIPSVLSEKGVREAPDSPEPEEGPELAPWSGGGGLLGLMSSPRGK